MDVMSQFNKNVMNFIGTSVGPENYRVGIHLASAASYINWREDIAKTPIFDPFKTGQENPFNNKRLIDDALDVTNCPKNIREHVKKLIIEQLTKGHDVKKEASFKGNYNKAQCSIG